MFIVDETTPRRKTIIVDGPESEEQFIRLNVGGQQVLIFRRYHYYSRVVLLLLTAKFIRLQVFVPQVTMRIFKTCVNFSFASDEIR